MITRQRLEEIASRVLDKLIENDPDEAIEFIDEELELTDEERKYFCVEDNIDEARKLWGEEEETTTLTVTCGVCGEETEYELSAEDSETYEKYLIYGRELGYLQDLFPNVPAWIRSGAIDKYSGGFCICPKCSGMEG